MTPFFHDDHLTVYQGDCREVMAAMAPESVHCVVTSPPYWGLRDYGTATWIGGDDGCDHVADPSRTKKFGNPEFNENRPSREETKTTGYYEPTCPKCGAVRQDSQLGLEPTPEAFVANMVAVFREVRRVLRKDGTLWLNLGDSYASTPPGNGKGFTPESTGLHGGRNSARYQATMDAGAGTKRSTIVSGLKPKDLVGIPWRVAFALQADGWYLRSDIIWSKPNPMPESVTDRPTKAHEYLFLLTKSARYYFDGEAVRLPISPHNDGRVSVQPHGDHVMAEGHRRQEMRQYDEIKGANLRSVWSIATEPYPGAHFATFPRKLVEPCVKAGTSERGVCPECGAPWTREVELTPEYAALLDSGKAWRTDEGKPDAYTNRHPKDHPQNVPPKNVTTGWRPSCAHDAEPVAATVLDPFAGSGTTGLVAQSLGRRAVLIDLSADYLLQLMSRNQQTPLGIVG